MEHTPVGYVWDTGKKFFEQMLDGDTTSEALDKTRKQHPFGWPNSAIIAFVGDGSLKIIDDTIPIEGFYLPVEGYYIAKTHDNSRLNLINGALTVDLLEAHKSTDLLAFDTNGSSIGFKNDRLMASLTLGGNKLRFTKTNEGFDEAIKKMLRRWSTDHWRFLHKMPDGQIVEVMTKMNATQLNEDEFVYELDDIYSNIWIRFKRDPDRVGGDSATGSRRESSISLTLNN